MLLLGNWEVHEGRILYLRKVWILNFQRQPCSSRGCHELAQVPEGEGTTEKVQCPQFPKGWLNHIKNVSMIHGIIKNRWGQIKVNISLPQPQTLKASHMTENPGISKIMICNCHSQIRSFLYTGHLPGCFMYAALFYPILYIRYYGHYL
jgi:hypothetical protein